MSIVRLYEKRCRNFMTMTFRLLENIRNKTLGDDSPDNIG